MGASVENGFAGAEFAADVIGSANALALVSGTAASLSLLAGGSESRSLFPTPFTQSICLSEDMLVAGTTHADGIDSIVEDLRPGDRLRFLRAPENPHDKWAVEVYDPLDRRAGFLPADSNEMIARLMDAGKLVYGTFSRASRRGSWNKIHMEVYLDD